jgi:small subunit ribosomal protein S21
MLSKKHSRTQKFKFHGDYFNLILPVFSGRSYLIILKKNSGTKMQVSVRDNNVDQALRALKKKLQREGVFREVRLKEHFEKPSIRKAREKKEAISRQRKLARKKAEREG